MPSVYQTTDPIGDQPIFILGSGRCGSTFLQTSLCKIDDIWVWGEHDGIIGSLLQWAGAAKTSEKLTSFAFANADLDPAAIIRGPLSGDATRAAWLNGFAPGDIDAGTRNIIAGLMRARLPAGKRRWGFKEIRYGKADKTAEGLLRLFPAARLLHVVRNPFATIESSIGAWHLSALEAALTSGDQSKLDRLYRGYAQTWAETTAYYIDLERGMPARVRTFRLEDLASDVGPVLSFIEASLLPGQLITYMKVNESNGARRMKGPHGIKILEACRLAVAPIVSKCAAHLGYFTT